MTQALFEVQTFDGHGWVTRHRGADVDSAGEAARRVLPEAKRTAVRIVKQVYDPEQQRLDNQVVFALGKPRRRGIARAAGVAAALALSAAAIVGAALIPVLGPDAPAGLAAAAAATTTTAAETMPDAAIPAVDASRIAAQQAALEALRPAAGLAGAGFDCEREAANGLVRASNVPVELNRLYELCGQAVQGDPAAQVDLAARLAAGDGTAADPAQAVLWLQEAARAGHVAAYRPLADVLTGIDPARAISWYHRAATGGDTAAALTLAERYRAGVGVESDPRIALSYELMAAEGGDVAAMLRVAEAFDRGHGAEANPDAARRWLERAAGAGSAEAVAALDQPSLRWAAPADLELATPLDGPADGLDAELATPADGESPLLSVPPLQLDIDHDAQEVFSAFLGAELPVSV